MGNVRIITARPHRLLRPLLEEVKRHWEKQEETLLLVPQQLTLTAELLVMEYLHAKTLIGITVLSPTKLYRNLQQETGHDSTEPLSESGQRMAVAQALENAQENLPYFGSRSGSRGFVEKLSVLITDLKRGAISPEDLKKTALSSEGDVPKAKFADLATIYARYEELLSGRFSDNEDRLSYAAKQVEGCRLLRGKILLVYGFDSLPEQLSRLLTAAAPLCGELAVTLICDREGAPDGGLYKPIRDGIRRFEKHLAENHVAWKEEPLRTEPLTDHFPGAQLLDRELFSSRKESGLPISGAHWFTGLNPFEEAEAMCRRVQSLLKYGVSPDRITVLYPDGAGYEFAMAAALSDAGIPWDDGQTLCALNHPLVRFLLDALRAMDGRWETRLMIPVFKNPYSPLTFEESCLLQEYAEAFGIRKEGWTNPFARGGKRAEACEPLRDKLMGPLLRCKEALLAAGNAKESAAALFRFLQDCGAYQTLRQEEEALLAAGQEVRAAQSSQIWKCVLQILQEMVRISADKRVPLKHIVRRLECGFSAIRLASLPPTGVRVRTGVLGHMLPQQAEAVFLLGLNDGILTRETCSLLQPEEREDAERLTGGFLGLTDQSRMTLARLDLKRTMTLPEKHLFLSWAEHSSAGETLEPLPQLQNVIPRCSQDRREEELPLSARQALNRLASGRVDERITQAARFAVENRDWRRILGTTRYESAPLTLPREMTRPLYGDRRMSVSRLEDFSACPFAHFLKNGLKPAAPEEWKPDSLLRGNASHEALDRFGKLLKTRKELPEKEELRRMAQEALEPVLQSLREGVYGDGARNGAQLELLCNAYYRAAEILTTQLSQGAFRLQGTELTFGGTDPDSLPGIILLQPDGSQVSLQGKIDRLDLCVQDGETWLRVIDYKSSGKELKAEEMWWGLQLQLLLYLEVCAQAFPGSLPAGAFYFHVADPLVDQAEDLEEAAEKALEKKLQLKGIVVDRAEILNNPGSTARSSIFQKDGTLKEDADAVTELQMKLLLEHSKMVAAGLAERIFSGETAIHPTRTKTRNACTYCLFGEICRFEQEAPDACWNYVPPMNMQSLRADLDQIAEKK